jgi:phytoene dehydrogenase-like protein
MSTIVIGAGLGGLAAAACLARAGEPVTVLERSERVGGRALTTGAGAYRLNLGPHALYRAGEGRAVLAELGLELHGAVPGTRGAYALDRERLHTLPAGPLSLLTTGLLGAAEKLSAARALAGLPRLDLELWRGRPLAAWLEAASPHPRVRALLSAVTRVASYSNAPDTADAAAVLQQVQRALAASVLYLDGGWQSLVDGLRDAALAAGAELRCGARVTSLRRTGGGWEVVTRGGHLRADAVVLAVDPGIAAGLVPELAAPVEALVPVRAACLDLALSSLPRPRVRFALGIDRPLYYSLHSAYARLAPEDGAVIHMARYLAPGERAGAEVRAELEAELDRLQPGWREHVVESRFAPALTVTHALPRAASGGLAGRPPVAAAPGLYLVGDWVGTEGMLADAALASARTAARAIAEHRREAQAA